jgi:hypothetical protein
VGFDRTRPNPEGFLTPRDSVPIGYAALVKRYALATLPNHRWSFAATKGAQRTIDNRFVIRTPMSGDAGDVEHLLFALKYDGVNLAILAELFQVADRKRLEKELTAAIRATPAGRHHRRLWYLYEWLTGRRLSMESPATQAYVPVLDASEYVVGPARKQPRHRVIDNLPGSAAFCPLVRITDELAKRSSIALRAKLDAIVSNFDEDLLKRALSFIYTKETQSSFAIERERPSTSRIERFAALLETSYALAEVSEQSLTEIQNRIVDPRYAENGYRDVQNYVGESIGPYRQLVHYAAPKPDDVRPLMEGLIAMLRDGTQTISDPVALAAMIAFGFVFVHPFKDGNGRIHRFLVHHVLARTGITPDKLIVPVSAVMLARRAEYDATLETFSRPLMKLLEYDLDNEGRLTVYNETARYYRYFDATSLTEALYRWLDEAIDVELREELTFLVGLRSARAAMRDIVDLPDAEADLFIKIVISNQGRLSKRKREHFQMLTDDEVAALEGAIRKHMLPTAKA